MLIGSVRVVLVLCFCLPKVTNNMTIADTTTALCEVDIVESTALLLHMTGSEQYNLSKQWLACVAAENTE